MNSIKTSSDVYREIGEINVQLKGLTDRAQIKALKIKALELEAEANCLQAQESFERCDTDGFRTQHAHQKHAEKNRLEIHLLEADGLWKFPALFDISTKTRVRAKLIKSRYGFCWAFCDAADKFTGKFLKCNPKPVSGYYEDEEEAKGIVTYDRDASDLYYYIGRADKGYPENSTPVAK